MIETLSIDDLRQYNQGNYSGKRKEEIENFLAKNPHYFNMLEGLKTVEELVSEVDPTDYLEGVHNKMKNALFSPKK